MIELDMTTNIFGTFKPEYKKKILAYIQKPSVKKWDEIHCIIIEGKSFMTIWQAVIAVDSTFPKRGRAEDLKGNILEEWSRIPSPELIKKALIFATH